MKRRTVEILLTGDMDYSTHHHEDGKRQALEHMLQAGRDLDGAITFFFVAREAAVGSGSAIEAGAACALQPIRAIRIIR